MRAALLAGLAVSMLAAGCVSERYGRLSPVSPVQAGGLDCEDVDAELYRTEGFLAQIRSDSGFWPISAIADSSTGNARERSEARASAEARRTQLVSMHAAMGCAPRGGV